MPEKFPDITAEEGDNLFDKDRLETEQKALAITDRINELKDKDELAEEEQKELLGLIDKLERIYSPEASEQFEAIPNLKEQYESQKAILEKAGILTNLGRPRGSSESFMVDITDGMCTFPKYEEVLEKLEAQKEMIEKKAEQGFTKLLIVPFGMKLENLIEKYKQVLSKHAKDGKLLATKENPNDPDEKLELRINNPVNGLDRYKDADTSGKLVYPRMQFLHHVGLTKKEILENEGAWRILLTEDNSTIPREGKGKTIGERKQLEAGRSCNEYIELLGQDQYHDEVGLTLEDWLTQAIVKLEETNQVIDDSRGEGGIPVLTGSYFPASSLVPYACWDRPNRLANLSVISPAINDSRYGTRSAVKV